MSRRFLATLVLLLTAGCHAQPDVAATAPPQDAWFEQEVTAQPTPVIVDFTASWCGPCQMLKPFLEQLEKDHAGKVKVVPIDVDARADLAGHYKVSSYPTLLMMQGGKVVDVCRGAPPSYESLMKWAGPHLK
jgi:thioredoxin